MFIKVKRFTFEYFNGENRLMYTEKSTRKQPLDVPLAYPEQKEFIANFFKDRLTKNEHASVVVKFASRRYLFK